MNCLHGGEEPVALQIERHVVCVRAGRHLGHLDGLNQTQWSLHEDNGCGSERNKDEDKDVSQRNGPHKMQRGALADGTRSNCDIPGD